jgi:hypothetical protein
LIVHKNRPKQGGYFLFSYHPQAWYISKFVLEWFPDKNLGDVFSEQEYNHSRIKQFPELEVESWKNWISRKT